jgi:adenosylhomocysteinase
MSQQAPARNTPTNSASQVSFDKMHNWIHHNMPVTAAACAALPDLSQVRLAYSGHISYNVMTALAAFLDKGAELFLLTCNPTTVRDDVVAWLQEQGAQAHAWKDMSAADYSQGVEKVLEWQPTHTCEMGADITTAAHKKGADGITVALEATGSGINRLAGLTPRYPIFNWDDLPVKEGLHNRHMVGLMTWQAFSERTFLSLHGKRVVVVGYGLVGRGVADAARAYGGVVSVVERSSDKRLEARFAGWHTGTLEDLAPEADVIVTATGVTKVVDRKILALTKPGCFLLNVGHVADEIEVDAFETRQEVFPHVERVSVGSKELYLFAGGSMANLTAGQGDSLNAFDITAAVMVSGIGFIAQEGARWEAGVYPLPRQVWLEAADRAVTIGHW